MFSYLKRYKFYPEDYANIFKLKKQIKLNKLIKKLIALVLNHVLKKEDRRFCLALFGGWNYC